MSICTLVKHWSQFCLIQFYWAAFISSSSWSSHLFLSSNSSLWFSLISLLSPSHRQSGKFSSSKCQMASQYSSFFHLEVSNSSGNAALSYYYRFSRGMPLGNALASVCVLSIFLLLMTNSWQVERKNTKAESSVNFKHTHGPAYKVKKVWCEMAELMALQSKCLQWDPLVMKGGMQERNKSVLIA